MAEKPPFTLAGPFDATVINPPDKEEGESGAVNPEPRTFNPTKAVPDVASQEKAEERFFRQRERKSEIEAMKGYEKDLTLLLAQYKITGEDAKVVWRLKNISTNEIVSVPSLPKDLTDFEFVDVVLSTEALKKIEMGRKLKS